MNRGSALPETGNMQEVITTVTIIKKNKIPDDP